MADQLLRTGFRFYQSANADAERIRDGFIIRKNEYEIIIEDIRRNPMSGSVQHYLLLGRRGSGKSTLLKRIQVEIESDEKLSESHVAINLAEEQANIYRLSDLWEEILQELEQSGIEVSFPDWEDNTQVYSKNLITSVHNAINKSGKKVVLLLDNIDRIFENLKDDASLLREYLLNFDDLKIIGGSTRMTEHFWQYDQPFYEFFRILNLPPLTSDEVKSLLLFWAEKLGQPELKTFVEKQTGQLETVRILTDGLPRTLQFFVNILLTNTQETGYEYLKLIMDQVTPLYQERLNNLPPSQRKIVLQLAFIWEAASTKELTSVVHMDNKIISAQLKQLYDKGIVDKIETNTKNHLYRLSERFFNLWLIFTQGSPHEKRKAKCLTIFLENFYDTIEFKKLAISHLRKLKVGNLDPNKAALLSKAIAQSKNITFGEREELILNTINLKGINHELKQQLPQLITAILEKINAAVDKTDWSKALRIANDIEQEDEAKWSLLGYIYSSKGDLTVAKQYFALAAKRGHINSIGNLGAILYLEKDYVEAEKYLLTAAKSGQAYSMFFLAALYTDQKNHKRAEKYFLEAIDNGFVKATYSLALMYEIQERDLEAEKYFKLAIENDESDAAFSLALLYLKLNKQKKAAKKLIDECIDKEGYLDLDLRQQMIVLNIYLWVGDMKNSIELLEKFIDTQDIAQEDVESLIYGGLLMFLVHHQTNFVYDLFYNSDLGSDLTERFQPLYYAVSILIGKDQTISLKLPPEIETTVNEVLDDIYKMQTFYYQDPIEE